MRSGLLFILLALPLLPGGIYEFTQGNVPNGALALWQWLMLTATGALYIRRARP